jgi:hypothetical protein
VTQARLNLQGYARLHQVVFDKGFGSPGLAVVTYLAKIDSVDLISSPRA